MASATDDAIAKLIGIYTFEHPGGSFDVHLRSKGRFFAPRFQARATWNCTEAGELFIDWGKYGQYKLDIVDPATRAFSGAAVGKPESWRKMVRRREFSVAEQAIMDSEWKLEHPGGSFLVEFRADGFNHCACRTRVHFIFLSDHASPRLFVLYAVICNDFPAHSHWRFENEESATPTVYINWGKYGEYTMVVAADGMSMAGSAKDQPDNWRKATRTRTLGEVEEAHVHDH